MNFIHLVTGLNEVPFIGLAYALPEVVSRLFRCDIETVFFCSKHHYSIITSSVIALIILTILGSVFSLVGIPFVATLLSILGFGSIVMVIAFSYAPGCAPMIPACFFSSLVDDIARLLPKRLLIPQSLLKCKWDQFIDGVPPSDCIVQCAEDPFYFTDWNANVAWMLCDFSEQNCQTVQDYLAIPGNATACCSVQT